MGVTKTIIAEGTGAQPTAGQTVTIEYTGWLKDTSKPDNKGDKWVLLKMFHRPDLKLPRHPSSQHHHHHLTTPATAMSRRLLLLRAGCVPVVWRRLLFILLITDMFTNLSPTMIGSTRPSAEATLSHESALARLSEVGFVTAIFEKLCLMIWMTRLGWWCHPDEGGREGHLGHLQVWTLVGMASMRRRLTWLFSSDFGYGARYVSMNTVYFFLLLAMLHHRNCVPAALSIS